MKTLVRLVIVVLLWCTVSPGTVAPSADSEAASPPPSSEERPLVGIGIGLKPPLPVDGEQRVQDSLEVFQLVPNRPAHLCGEIKIGDRVIAVAQGTETPRPVDGLLFSEVIEMIRGPAETEVRLTIVPRNDAFVKSKVVAITREPLVETDLIGRTVPDKELIAFSGAERRDLKSFRGSVLVLEFWTASCAPCRVQIAELQELSIRNPAWNGKANLVTVNVDDQQATAEQALADVGWSQTLNTWGNADVRDAFHADIVPLVVVVDRDGQIVAAGNPRSINVEKILNDLITEN